MIRTNFGNMNLEEHKPGHVRFVGGGVDGHAGGSASRPVGVAVGVASRRGNCEPVSRPAPSLPEEKYDSKLERARGTYWGYLLLAGDIKSVRHHPFVIHLPGGVTYTPDYMVWWADGRIWIEEVKGNLKQKNARDSITRWRISAGLFPMFEFILTMRPRGQWEEKAA